ncbi:MAG: LamG domain-containing protein [Verrucomicrobia bacterium]|nr:LamG domain-containing protein [Verrucomicrobiota bacterium]
MTKRALRLLAAVTSLVGMGAGQAGVVAQWHFDEADGAIARDSLGSLDGALSATGATFVPGGIAGNAIRLDGTQNGWVSMGNALGLTNGDFSIVLWVKTTATEGDTVVLGKHEAFSENGYFFAINPTGAAARRTRRPSWSPSLSAMA